LNCYKQLSKTVENGQNTDKFISGEKLAQTLLKTGKKRDALARYRKVLRLAESEQRLENNNLYNTWYMATLVHCGDICLVCKEYKNTIDSFKKALPIAQEQLGKNDPYVLTLVKHYCRARENWPSNSLKSLF